MPKSVYFYVFDTLADWEPGFALAELRSGRMARPGSGPFEVRTCAVSRAPVTTMGGVRIMPDITLEEVSSSDAALFLLPGGFTWREEIHAPALALAAKFLRAGIPVAAICGAVEALAGAGLLNERRHTGNAKESLKAVAGYAGEELYADVPAICGGDLVTASGLAPLEFAREIFRRLDSMSPRVIDAWYELFRTREPRCYFSLMEALKAPEAQS